jgi:hypothetical protein
MATAMGKSETAGIRPPSRISDLLQWKLRSSRVFCRATFDVIPMYFTEDDPAYRALMFLCRFSGTIDGEEYGFRKCYARGCPDGHCPATYKAILAANHYMKSDLEKLRRAGILLERPKLTLESYAKKIENRALNQGAMRMEDTIALAKDRGGISIEPWLQWVHAREQLPNFEVKMVFLMVNFAVHYDNQIKNYEMCLSCYPLDQENEQKNEKIVVANERLRSLYARLEVSFTRFTKQFF